MSVNSTPKSVAAEQVVLGSSGRVLTDAEVAERVDALMAEMTIEEKAGQLTQYFYFNLAPSEEIEATLHADFSRQPAMVEASLSEGKVGSLLFVTDPAEVNRLQRLAVEGNWQGIPALFGFDVIHGLRTIMPVPVGMAASWDPAVIEQGQAVAAREARAVGIHWAFAPMVDIARDPRWGRIIEGAGEDPYLGSAVAVAQVRGFQGEAVGSLDRIIAGPKHFAGYGAALGGRDYDEVNLSEAELWNVYLPPFKAVVEAGVEHHDRLHGPQRRPGHRQPLAAPRRAAAAVGLGFVVSGRPSRAQPAHPRLRRRPDRCRGASGQGRGRSGDGNHRPRLRTPAGGGRGRSG